MRDRLAREFRLVRIVAAFGTVLTGIGCVISLLTALIFFYARQHGLLESLLPLQYWAQQAIEVAVLIMLLSLFLFFARLARGADPLGRRQVRRVAIAGHMFALRALLGALEAPFPAIEISEGPVPVGITFDGGLDLKIIAFITIILCAAAIMRYGRALEEELSDIA